jgi:glucokinase
MDKKKLILGIDIGGTNTVYGFISDTGEYVSGGTIPTRGDETADKFMSRLVKNINTSFETHQGSYFLKGIGIAAPSVNYLKGTIESPSNLHWNNVDLVSMMKEYFKIPVAIINDANAAALGEFYFGHAKGLKNFIVITLGTGVGAGIFVDGNLLYGERGLAGELGHVIVVPEGRNCNCGRSGCLETYISATGVKRTVFEMMARYTDASKLRDVTFNEMTGQMISDLAADGDSIAVKAYDYTGNILGRAMANLSAHYSPQMIILFGGLVNAGELLLEPAQRYFEEKLLNVHKGKIQVRISKLNNATAGIYGASSLILSGMRKEPVESKYV